MAGGYLGNIYNSSDSSDSDNCGNGNNQYYPSNNTMKKLIQYPDNNNVTNQRIEETFIDKKTKNIIIWVILTPIILFIVIELISYILYKLKLIDGIT